MRLPNAPHYEPPIDPSKPISHINTRELRLFLEGESAAALPPIPSQPIQISIPTPAPYSQFPQTSGNIANGTYFSSSPSLFCNLNTLKNSHYSLLGRSIKEGYVNKADHNKKMKKIWVTLDKNFVYFYKTALVYLAPLVYVLPLLIISI
jgi:hypothetical protein